MAIIRTIHEREESPILHKLKERAKKNADKVFDQYKRNLKNEIKKQNGSGK